MSKPTYTRKTRLYNTSIDISGNPVGGAEVEVLLNSPNDGSTDAIYNGPIFRYGTPTCLAYDFERDILYISDQDNKRIRSYNNDATVGNTSFTESDLVAGTGDPGYSGDGGAAVNAEIQGSEGIAIGLNGDIFFSDPINNVVRKITKSTGIITTVVDDNSNYTDIPLLSFVNPARLEEHGGFIYLVDKGGNAVYKIDPSNNTGRVFAGIPGSAGSSGDGGTYHAPAASERFSSGGPGELGPDAGAIDLTGSNILQDQTIYQKGAIGSDFTYTVPNLAFTTAYTVRLHYAEIQFTSAGTRQFNVLINGVQVETNYDIYAVATVDHKALSVDYSATSDGSGNIAIEFVAGAFDNPTVMAVEILDASATNDVIIVNCAGPTVYLDIPSTSPATSALLHDPVGITFDAAGNAYIGDRLNNSIRKVDTSGNISHFAITPSGGDGGDGGQAILADAENIESVTCDPSNKILFIVDSNHAKIRRVDLETRIITTQDLSTLTINTPTDIYFSPADSQMFIWDGGLPDLMLLQPTNLTSLSFIARGGNLGQGFAGDGAAYTAGVAQISEGSFGIYYEPTSDTLYFCDAGNNVVRKISFAAGGIISEVAGNQVAGAGFSGDGGLATAAQLSNPTGIFVNTAGDVFISDTGNSKVRKVDHATGNISTLSFGDSGSSSQILFPLRVPKGLACDSNGNLYIADSGNNIVRKYDISSHAIAAVAGDGVQGYSGDGGGATSGQMNAPQSVFITADNTMYIGDTGNAVVRIVDNSSHNISTYAGNQALGPGFSGDSGTATDAQLGDDLPALFVDSMNNLHISDPSNNRLRKVTVSNGNIITIAGGGIADPGNEGPAASAVLESPQGIVILADGTIFISEATRSTIRRIDPVHQIHQLLGDGVFGYAGDGLISGVGDTVISRSVTATTVDVGPQTAPSLTVVASSGAIDAGTHKYAVSYVIDGVETGISPLSTVVAVNGTDSVHLANIPITTDPDVAATARMIYRSRSGENTLYLLTTLANNTATTFVDTVADSVLDLTHQSKTTGYWQLDVIAPGDLLPAGLTYSIIEQDITTSTSSFDANPNPVPIPVVVQSPPTPTGTVITLYDYVVRIDGSAIGGATVTCRISVDAVDTETSNSILQSNKLTTTSDVNGYYQFTVVPIAQITPASQYYIVNEGGSNRTKYFTTDTVGANGHIINNNLTVPVVSGTAGAPPGSVAADHIEADTFDTLTSLSTNVNNMNRVRSKFHYYTGAAWNTLTGILQTRVQPDLTEAATNDDLTLDGASLEGNLNRIRYVFSQIFGGTWNTIKHFLFLQAATPGTAQTGHANITGTIIAGGDLAIGGNADVEGTFNADGSTTFGGDVAITGNITAANFNILSVPPPGSTVVYTTPEGRQTLGAFGIWP